MANIIVLFEVTPTKEGMQKYLDLAAMLKPMLAGFEGQKYFANTLPDEHIPQETEILIKAKKWLGKKHFLYVSAGSWRCGWT